jgi:Fic family protein
MIYNSQARYYEALQQSHNVGVDCRPFIDFMLDIIETAISRYVASATGTSNDALAINEPVKSENEPVNDPVNSVNEPVNSFDVLGFIKANPSINYDNLVEQTGRSRATIKRMVKRLKEEGYISRIGSDKSGYWKINQ